MSNNQQPSYAELKAMVEKLEKQNAELTAKNNQPKEIRFSISLDKGAVSVSGLNATFPVTLYADQWKRLIAKVPDLEAFLTAHESILPLKADSVEIQATKLALRKDAMAKGGPVKEAKPAKNNQQAA